MAKRTHSLFIGTFPSGISYADRGVEEHGDYKKIAFLPYDTLELHVYAPRSTLVPSIKAHAKGIIAKRGEEYQTSASGQTVTLGYRNRSKGSTMRRRRHLRSTSHRRNRAGRAPTHRGTVDEAAARELELYVANDGDLYRQQETPIQKNLANKMANGKYDHEKAVKLYMYLMEIGAKKYVKEYGGGNWHAMFNVATRESAARSFVKSFETEYGLGNYKHHLTKAALKRMAAR